MRNTIGSAKQSLYLIGSVSLCDRVCVSPLAAYSSSMHVARNSFICSSSIARLFHIGFCHSTLRELPTVGSTCYLKLVWNRPDPWCHSDTSVRLYYICGIPYLNCYTDRMLQAHLYIQSNGFEFCLVILQYLIEQNQSIAIYLNLFLSLGCHQACCLLFGLKS